MLPFKAFYFFVFAALAFIAPFLTLYYEGLGLTGQQIGILAAVPPLVTFISAPFFGAIADITRRHKLVLGFSIIGVVTGILALSLAQSFLALISTVFFYAFFFAPLLPLIDRSVIEILGSDRNQYGKQRLWGAVGWGLLAPISGFAVDKGGIEWAFYGAAFLFLGLFIVSRLTPIRPVTIQVGYWEGLNELLSDWKVIVFFGITIIGGMGLATIHNYLYLDRLLKSWKARGLILFGLLMLTLRLFGYSVSESQELALLIQLMHGPTFAAIWIAGVAYVAEIAPPGLGNTAQGLFTGLVMGIGSALGALLGGILYQGMGFSKMYLAAGIVVFISLIIFWLVCRNDC